MYFPAATPTCFGLILLPVFIEIKKLPNTIKKQELFIWPDSRRDISSKSCACWVQESSFLQTVFYTHIHWLSQNKHAYDNHFPGIINIFSLFFTHAFFCPGGLSGGPRPQCYSWKFSLHKEHCASLGQGFLKNKHCADSPGIDHLSPANNPIARISMAPSSVNTFHCISCPCKGSSLAAFRQWMLLCGEGCQAVQAVFPST